MTDSTAAIDQPRDVRAGEALDMSHLAGYLQKHLPALGPHHRVSQFRAGHSNLTYLIEDLDAPDHAGYVLRRPPFGAQIKSGHDMRREFDVLSALHPHWPRVPGPHLCCEDISVLGAPFYIMERVRGVILRGPNPTHVTLDEPTMRAVCDALLDTLVEIHGLDVERVGLGSFGKPEGYVSRQVSGWSQRYLKAQTDTIDAMERVAAWLDAHQPHASSQGASLIHNDLKYDNLILDPQKLSQVRAVLDWEMATLGDPLMDLGTSLAYWVEPDDPFVLQQLRFGPTTQPGNMTRQALVDAYGERAGRDTSQLVFYYVFGLFKVATIAQQIYARYKGGFTRDERFAGLIFAVEALAEAAARAIDTGRVSA